MTKARMRWVLAEIRADDTKVFRDRTTGFVECAAVLRAEVVLMRVGGGPMRSETIRVEVEPAEALDFHSKDEAEVVKATLAVGHERARRAAEGYDAAYQDAVAAASGQ